MLLADVVATSAAVGATRSRSAKAAMLAELLGRTATESPEDIATVTSYLAGSLRQRRTGLGWRSLQDAPEPASTPTLTVAAVHETFDHLASLAGAGSQRARAEATTRLFSRATADEQRWLRSVITGEVRQGALDSLVQDGLAIAGGVAPAAVRRAAMMAGSTVDVATAALTGGEEALSAFVLSVGRPVLPMLASTAPTIEAAMAKAGGGDVAVDTKLDGIRIQVHRRGDDVLVVTRSLDDVTSRHPEVVAVALALPCDTVVLDGEVLALGPDGRPRPFQETASRTASQTGVELT
ncbi:MAG: ATP-dependent DNA ligase, partial [Aeromicrobium sp.]